MKSDTDEYFEISAVARLTGISSHVLRVWERRYGVVEPQRSNSKRRRYLREDIRRLSLLKTLVDSGHAIGSIAKLTTVQLEDRLAHSLENRASVDSPESEFSAGICRVAIAGTKIRQAVRMASDESPALRIVGEFLSREELEASLRAGSVDLLILEQDTIFPEDLPAIQDLVESQRARRALLVYQFASEDTIQLLDIKRITVLRAPVDAPEIQLACFAEIQLALRSSMVEAEGAGVASVRPALRPVGEVPPRLFTDEQLVRVSRISSAVKCECPQHLADLLFSLVAFERYSEQCEDRNEDDAVMHAYLHRTTAQARSGMETALAELLAQDGIEV